MNGAVCMESGGQTQKPHSCTFLNKKVPAFLFSLPTSCDTVYAYTVLTHLLLLQKRKGQKACIFCCIMFFCFSARLRSVATIRIILFPHPIHEQIRDAPLLFLAERNAGRYTVPFVETTAAAACAAMHGLKSRMPSHGRLFSVILRFRRCEFSAHEISRVRPNLLPPFFPDIRPVALIESETAPERGTRKLLQCFFFGLHKQKAGRTGLTHLLIRSDLKNGFFYPHRRNGGTAGCMRLAGRKMRKFPR